MHIHFLVYYDGIIVMRHYKSHSLQLELLFLLKGLLYLKITESAMKFSVAGN